MGLPQQHRLKHWQDFQRVYQSGRRFRQAHLLLRCLPHDSLRVSRFGISVGRKVSNRATVRNRIKRQIRAIILRYLPDLKLGFDIVIVVLPQGIECNYEHFLRELDQLFHQAEII